MVVEGYFIKPFLTKRLFAQDELSRSKNLHDSLELFMISAFATATLTMYSPYLLLNIKSVKTSSLFCPKSLALIVYLFSTKILSSLLGMT